MVDPRHVADVVDVVGEIGNGRDRRAVLGIPFRKLCFDRVGQPREKRLEPRAFSRSRRRMLTQVFRYEPRQRHRHHDAAILGHARQHAVGYVAQVAGNRPGPRMAEDDRSLRDIERIHHRRFADVAEIDKHPDAVHLAHDILAEGVEPVVLRCVGGAVGPAQRLAMRQRHVARAHVVHLAQYGEARPDRMAAFHAQQRSDATGRHRFLDIVGGQRKLQVLRIARDQTLGDVDLLDGGLHRLRFGEAGADIDRPPLCADLALPHTVEVRMHRVARIGSGVERITEIELVDHIAEPRAQLDRNVIVAIPHRRRLERRGSCAFGFGLRSGGCGNGQHGSGGGEQEMTHDRNPLMSRPQS